MSINWKQINDNIVNVGSILAKFIDTEVEQDVDFILVKDDGTVEDVKLKNLAYHLAKIKENAVDVTTVEEIIKNNTMSKEDIENYVNETVKQLETAIEAANGDTTQIQELLSQYYDKEDVDNIINTIKNDYLAKYNDINDKVISLTSDVVSLKTDVTDIKSNMENVNNLLVPELITDNKSLVSNKEYAVDTSEKEITVSLPLDPNDNDIIYILDGAYNAQNNPVTIQRNGKNINDTDEDLICDVNGFYVVLRFDANKDSWYVSNAVTNS